MHESRTFPRFLPRPVKELTIIIGHPLNPTIEPLLESYRTSFPSGWKPGEGKVEPDELKGMRSRLAEVLRGELMALNREK
jgi:hypothetical protein